ncbi:MAG: hypothetical protein OXH65_13490 [Paracoccaceae bacterium]|nr:hypothetical protein [Paracoccaceae bacterium]MXZ49225.1 hypothetical protein [Paracoccaceae bacterium]MYI92663.1 hypothetical protein [Paracoccaceae bacterium]
MNISPCLARKRNHRPNNLDGYLNPYLLPGRKRHTSKPGKGCLRPYDKRFSDLAVRHSRDRERWL